MMLAVSVDGRLVSGDSDALDPNKTWKQTSFIQSIIYQFFDLSPSKNLYNLTTTEILIRLGIAEPNFTPKKSPIKLVALETSWILPQEAIDNLAKSVDHLILVRKKSRLRKQMLPFNCSMLNYGDDLDLKKICFELKKKHGIKHLTVQSAGLMNSAWLATGIVDHLSIIIYPLLIGDNGTPCLLSRDVFSIRPLLLVGTTIFDQNYVSLQYDVRNEAPRG